MQSIDRRRNIDMGIEELNKGFTDFKGTSALPEIRQLENKYLGAIKKLIDKYEALYNTHESFKDEVTEKLNHYIALNNSLYSKNTELGIANKEKSETLNKVRNENHSLKFELEAQKSLIDKLRAQLNESFTMSQMNEKTINSLKQIQSQNEEEIYNFRRQYSTQERKHQEEKTHLLDQINAWSEKTKFIEENFLKATMDNKNIVGSFETKIAEKEKMAVESEQSLLENNKKLLNALSEIEALKQTLIDKDQQILNLAKNQKTLQYSLDQVSQQFQKQSKELYFQGTLINGKKEGRGVLKCSSYTYEGEFKNDVFCGKGKYTCFEPSQTFEGEFDNDGHFMGTTIRFPGFVYNGGVIKNKMEGKGYFQVGQKYVVEGKFKNNSFEAGSTAIMIDLISGEEIGLNWIADEKKLISSDAKHAACFRVDFLKGTFEKCSY